MENPNFFLGEEDKKWLDNLLSNFGEPVDEFSDLESMLPLDIEMSKIAGYFIDLTYPKMYFERS